MDLATGLVTMVASMRIMKATILLSLMLSYFSSCVY